MGTAQIEYGEGRVWSFVATANVTSGQVVYVENGQVRPTSATSQHVFGVALIPASAGKPVSVIMEGIVKIQTTGVDTVTAGDLFGSGVDGKGAERASTQLNERRLDLGFAIEDASRDAKVKIKLAW